jgi:hypothetical protein
MALLLWYNHIRFGSFLETGMRYTLTPFNMDLLMQEGRFMSSVYILPNLLYYFFAPIRLKDVFPFLRPIWDEYPVFTSFLKRFDLPDSHFVESITGLLFVMPTILFVGYLIGELVCGPPQLQAGIKSAPTADGHPERKMSINLISVIFLLGGIMAAIPVMLYFYVAARFLLDAVPLLAMASVIGAWRLHLSNRAYPIRGRVVTVLILVIVILAAIVSFILSLTGAGSRLDDLNPALYNWLVTLFSR